MLMCYGSLIILGGLGFVSMFELIRRILLGSQRGALSVQTKVVLTMTILFLVEAACSLLCSSGQGLLKISIMAIKL